MRRPHVYERSAPRARFDVAAPISRQAEAARAISRTLPKLIDDAKAEGLDRLADALEAARKEAEIASGAACVVASE